MSKFKPFLNQNYETILQNLLSTGELFDDDKFISDYSSIYKVNQTDLNITWKRPSEICQNAPQFIVDKIEPNDLDQGGIGDCWLISAMAAVTSVPEYAQRVIPLDQSFETNYAGIFRFRFWRFGEWVEIVVDDKLPVDENNELIYCHNKKDKNEMFGPLLEKAYAKLNTCYEFLDGGDSVDALIDMTGGIHERFKLKKEKDDDGTLRVVDPDKLWEIIFKSFSMKSLIGASISSRDGKGDEFIQDNGLAFGHAYSVLECFEVLEKNGNYELRNSSDESSSTKSIKLLKIRNPWGETKSYSGKWSQNSPEWNKIGSEIKQALKMNDQTDGQFLISLTEFIKEFDELDMVHVNMSAFTGSSEMTANVSWITKQMSGSWKRGINAGGCGNDRYEDFWKNPQYLINVQLDNNQDNFVTTIISLMQTDQNLRRLNTDATYEKSNEPMNISVYKVKNGVGLKKKYNFSEVNEIHSNPSYLPQREVTAKLDLEPGDYVIIPSLFEKDMEGNFLLRIFLEGQTNSDVKLKSFDLNKKVKTKKDTKSVTNEESGEIQIVPNKKTEEEEEEYEDEYVNYNEELEIPEEFKTERKYYEKVVMENVLGPGGQVVSRACQIM